MTLPSLSRLGSILMLAMAGRRTPLNAKLVQRMMSGFALVVGLAVIIALFVAGLLFVGLYASYAGLVANGLAPHVALLVTSLLVAAIICVLLLVLQSHMRKLRALPSALMQEEAPLMAGASGIANAFMDGLLGDRPASQG